VAAPVARASTAERLLSLAAGLLGLASVASLLAWVFGIGSFAAWFWGLSFPATLTLAALAVTLIRQDRYRSVQVALAAGALGGLLGTLGYDLFRVPFVAAGMRLFAPIESYGVLLLGAATSSRWTDLAGWAYHFANGIGFGVAYAAVALGRHWGWGVLWGLILESATLVTPFADAYALRGQWSAIGVAYAAHVPYGLALGVVVQRAARWRSPAMSPIPVSWAFAALALGLLLWHQPFRGPAALPPAPPAPPLAPGPAAAVRQGRLVPEWLRVAPGGCATIVNQDAEAYTLSGPPGAPAGAPRLGPGAVTRVCFDTPGVHRLRTSDLPYSGGFAIVDAAGA
jgi:hypothetical protein